MNSTVKADQLSYTEMVLDVAGSIVSREEKAHLRQQYGYCMTCQDTPVLLVDFQRARLNPLWSSKKPRSADGECLNGKCLRCNPHIIPTASCVPVRSGPIPSASQQSITSCDSTGSFGIPSESFHSSSSGRPQLVSGSSSSRRSTGGNGSFTVNELIEPRRARSTDQMPLTITQPRDSRPMPPRRTVSFDRSPHVAPGASRPGSRRQPPSLRNSLHANPTGLLSASTSAITAGPTAPVRRPSVYSSTPTLPVSPTSRPVAPVRALSGVEVLGRMPAMDTVAPVAAVLCRATSDDEVPIAPGESSRSFDIVGSVNQDEEKVAETCDEEWSSSSMKSPEPQMEGDQIVYDLRSLIDGMKGEDVAFLTEILLGSMEANEQHEGVQAYCLEAMADIFQDAVTESTELISKIVSVMKAFVASLEIQRSGCKVLTALACNANNCVVLIRAKACESIADALSRHIGDAGLVEVAVSGLRKLSINWEAREKLLNQQISDRVAEAMQCHSSADVQRDGCALLSNIAVDGEKRRVCVVSVEVLNATVASIKSHSREAVVVQSACFALKNFTYDGTNLRSLTKVFGVFEILQEAASHGLEGCEDCFVVLERMQLARAEDESLEEQAYEAMLTQVSVSDSSVVVEITSVMRNMEWSAMIVAQGFQILSALATDPAHKTEIEKKEIHSQLFGFIEQYITDIRVQQEAQSLMAVLGADGEVVTGTLPSEMGSIEA